MRRAYDYWQNQPGCLPTKSRPETLTSQTHHLSRRQSTSQRDFGETLSIGWIASTRTSPPLPLGSLGARLSTGTICNCRLALTQKAIIKLYDSCSDDAFRLATSGPTFAVQPWGYFPGAAYPISISCDTPNRAPPQCSNHTSSPTTTPPRSYLLWNRDPNRPRHGAAFKPTPVAGHSFRADILHP